MNSLVRVKKLSDELERVAYEAADVIRCAEVPAMTIHELAEALRYCVDDEVGEETSVENARAVFERVGKLRSGEEQPYNFAAEIAMERAEEEVSVRNVAANEESTMKEANYHTGNNYLHVATVLAQAEYRLKLLFNKYGLRVSSPFFNAVYQRIELTVAKATQAEATDE